MCRISLCEVNMPVSFNERMNYPQYNMYNIAYKGKKQISGSESTGSMAKLGIYGSESTGSMADGETVKNIPDEGDKVCFRGRADGEKSKAGGCVIGTLAGASALMILFGCTHKYNWLNKVGGGKCKDFVVKYLTEPSYKACSWIKGKGNSAWNWVKGIFKK